MLIVSYLSVYNSDLHNRQTRRKTVYTKISKVNFGTWFIIFFWMGNCEWENGSGNGYNN